MNPYAEHNAANKAALPDPDMQVIIGGQAIKIHSIEAIHAHAAAVSSEKDARIKELEDALKSARYRNMVDARISYRGYSYGMRSIDGIADLRRAIERDGNG